MFLSGKENFEEWDKTRNNLCSKVLFFIFLILSHGIQIFEWWEMRCKNL